MADAGFPRRPGEGVIDPAMETIAKEGQRSVESHLADYEAKLKTANRAAKHVRETMKYIRETCEESGFTTVAQINPDGVNRRARKLQIAGKSARTVQAVLTAMKGFTRWLANEYKLPRDPLVGVHKPNPKTDRSYERRMLLPEEWQWLNRTTRNGTPRYGMSGHERALLYAVAIQTGLRSNELRSLRQRQLQLDADPPYVTCKAANTKNGDMARQFILSELAGELRALLEAKSPKAAVFNLPHESNMARMLREDLEDARKAWVSEAGEDADELARREESDFLAIQNHEGEWLDFHALRHTCGAWLAMKGAYPKTVQSVMRHGSITLTMDTYGHLFPGQEAEAISRFKSLMDGSFSPGNCRRG